MAVQVIHTDLPTTLNAMERTSIEFEELGRSLNMLSGPIKRAAVPALAVRAVSNNTGDSMRRIAHDVTSLTQVTSAHEQPGSAQTTSAELQIILPAL